MSESPPPFVAEPPAGRFARRAATLSVLAPIVAFLIGAFVYPKVGGIETATIVAGSLLLLIVSGLTVGIIALVATKRHGRRGIFAKALTGICINGLLLLLIPGLMLLSLLPLFFQRGIARTPEGRLDAANKALSEASTEVDRFYALDDAAKESFEVGNIADADKNARQLLMLAQKFKGDWNYGNAIQDGNLVLGRIALRDGRVEEARQYLLEAGKSPGSPQMNSFGPNMTLARDLIAKGDKETVLQYFELCRKFWKMDYGKLDQWSKEVKAGQSPDFGANLAY